jgi:LmbE family N-acetylglucosaminyl deacetylase
MIGQVTTVVAFHAHPDDEVLLTGGSLAKLAAEGSRVVIVMATDGIMGQASDRRLRELQASADRLGAARVVHLGYADSGHGPVLFPDPPGRVRFARADLDQAAAQLARILRDEQARLLVSYDAGGGYGHRDHVKVHQVGARAAQLAGDVRVLEATWPPWLVKLAARHGPRDARMALSPQTAITHRVNVRRYAAQKQAALAAHRSQHSASGRAARLIRLLIRLPAPIFGALLGYEWFAEPGLDRHRSPISHPGSDTRTPLSTGSKGRRPLASAARAGGGKSRVATRDGRYCREMMSP